MRNLTVKFFDRLSASYWFVPMLLVILAMLLALGTIQIDLRVGRDLAELLQPYVQATPEGVRSVLTTVASTMITVAGTVFSLTMVVLTLAAQQYGPLVVTNFMRDRTNQFALGAFVSTFIYCLMVLPTIEGDTDLFIPVLSGLVAVILALFDAGTLIYFIHHVSGSVQPAYIIGNISDNLTASMQHLFPDSIGQSSGQIEAVERAHKPTDFDDRTHPVYANRSGYLQLIDGEEVMALTTENDLILQFALRPGAFLIEGAILARLYPEERVTDEIVARLYDAISLGNERTLVQDSDLMVTQLAQVALRALSPGINDPYTAMMCIDRLGQAVGEIARRGTPAPYRFDADGHLRVITDPLDFRELLHTSFNGILHYGMSDPSIISYLLHTLEEIAQVKQTVQQRDVLQKYGERIWQSARTNIPDANVLEGIRAEFDNLQELLRESDAQRADEREAN